MFYEEFTIKLIKFLRTVWDRVIFLDLETKNLENKFLHNERILSVCFSRRVNGKLCEEKGVEAKCLLLEEDDESEKNLLTGLDRELMKIRPLGVIGYGLRRYDIPLLIIKEERCKEGSGKRWWKINDMLESAAHIDLYHLFKYYGLGGKLHEVLNSKISEDLPSIRAKDSISADRNLKGMQIYDLWKNSKPAFKKYALGDVIDLQLILEKIIVNDFQTSHFDQ
ncbi:MAG: hypothetical protein QXR19_18340 [Candidatus Jordarchaeaceae archaeon]